MKSDTPENRLEAFFAFVDTAKPKFVIARFYEGRLADYDAAETEAEALKIQAQFKQFGGRVDIYEGTVSLPFDPKIAN